MMFDEDLNSPVAVLLCPDTEPRHSCDFAVGGLNAFETEPLTRSGEAEARSSAGRQTVFDLSGTNTVPLTVACPSPAPRRSVGIPSCMPDSKRSTEVNMVVVDRTVPVTGDAWSMPGISCADNAPVGVDPRAVEAVCGVEPFTPVGGHEVPARARVEYVSAPISALCVKSRAAAICIGAIQRSSVSVYLIVSNTSRRTGAVVSSTPQVSRVRSENGIPSRQMR